MAAKICSSTRVPTHLFASVNRIGIQPAAQCDRQRLQIILRHRRQMLRDRAAFRQALATTLSPLLQAGLQLSITLEDRYLHRPQYVAKFLLFGRQWMIVRTPTLRGSRWSLKSGCQTLLSDCLSREFEVKLCYTLSQYQYMRRLQAAYHQLMRLPV